MSREVWSDIPEYGDYEVSNTGEVRKKSNGRILKQTIIATGDRTVGMTHDETGVYKRNKVKDLVWLAFRLEDVPIGMIIRHVNGKQDDNSVSNLFMDVKKPRGLSIKVRNLESGEEFKSISAAARTMKTTGSHLSYYIKNNTPFCGQRFEIIKD